MSMKLSQSSMLQPYYEVYFNGASSPLHDNLKKYITLIEYEESDSEADLVRITVSDVDLIFSNSLKLTKKMAVKVRMGFKNNLRTVLIGEVTIIEANFGEDGFISLVISVIDTTNQMTTVKRSRKWTKQRSSDVVKQVARSYGYVPVVTTSAYVVDEITQESETDAELLSKLASDEAFQFYVIPATNKLYFGERVYDALPLDSVFYNTNDCTVRYFRPTFTEKNKPENSASTEGSVSDNTGNSVESTTDGDSNSGNNNSGDSGQDSSQYVIDTLTGELQKEER